MAHAPGSRPCGKCHISNGNSRKQIATLASVRYFDVGWLSFAPIAHGRRQCTRRDNSIHILRHNITAVHQATSHVLAVTRVTLGHHRGVLATIFLRHFHIDLTELKIDFFMAWPANVNVVVASLMAPPEATSFLTVWPSPLTHARAWFLLSEHCLGRHHNGRQPTLSEQAEPIVPLRQLCQDFVSKT